MKIFKTASYKKIEKESYVPPAPENLKGPVENESGTCSQCGNRYMREQLKRYNGKCRLCSESKKTASYRPVR